MTLTLIRSAAAAAVLTFSLPAAATLPTPSDAAAPRQAQAFLFKAGGSDIFEIVTSQMALQHSVNPAVKAFASMLIADHTKATTDALNAAKSAGVMAPPPELSPMQKSMIAQLAATPPAQFDRVYLSQQLPAHQQALALVRAYANGGDTPALRQAASALVPVVEGHIAVVRRLQAGGR